MCWIEQSIHGNFPEFDCLVDRLIELALEEDLGPGDVTTQALIPPDRKGAAQIRAKESLVVAGLPVAHRVFQKLESQVQFFSVALEGQEVTPGSILAQVRGPLAAILTAERTALNFLMHLSGIATYTRKMVNAVSGFPTTIVDTRKTTPGWRALEKYAVRVGGAANHRMGLYDGVLIKENHIAAAGSIAEAVAQARRHAPDNIPVEVEVENLTEVREALGAGADILLLDNMDPPTLREAVAINRGQAKLEASGGVTLTTIRAIAETGVDYISVGELTKHLRALDLSMRFTSP